MTNKQYAVLDFIKRFMAEKGYAPTIREIMDGLGLKSPSPVQDHLKNLAMYGLITYKPQKSRTIDLLVPNEYENVKFVNLQIIDSDDNLDIPSYLIKDNNVDDLFIYKENENIYIVSKINLHKKYSLFKNNNEYFIDSNSKQAFVGSVICKIIKY